MKPVIERQVERAEELAAGDPPTSARQAYSTPVLEVLGDIRDLTMGGSPGAGDSGTGYVEFPPGWPG